ncbi:MAG: hypothetical protein AUJ25_03430 [Parcubacteria group bacterium CG1_02_37_13]|nr:MAG: hypothetical protein AUJ25_03430 [Parcubacteria group bacterium CG1_02_37_13]
MSKKILITGSEGFVGPYLRELAVLKGDDVFGITQSECDLTDFKKTDGLLNKIQPDVIFHLAGKSSVTDSLQDPFATFSTNIFSVLNILESARQLKSKPVILSAGSSEEYGILSSTAPLKEEMPLNPTSPYGSSKVIQENIALQYFKHFKVKVVLSRTFNHTGPKQGPRAVAPAFARQIAEIELGLKAPLLKVGNLEAVRDFSDVRDIVKAYYLASEKCDFGIPYNISSDKAVKIADILETLLSFSKIRITVEKDPNLFRPVDVPIKVGDSSRFRRKTGWENKIPLEKTLLDILNYFRNELAK